MTHGAPECTSFKKVPRSDQLRLTLSSSTEPNLHYHFLQSGAHHQLLLLGNSVAAEGSFLRLPKSLFDQLRLIIQRSTDDGRNSETVCHTLIEL